VVPIRSVRPRCPLALSTAAFAAALLACGEARADVSSWFAVGGGGSTQLQEGAATRNIVPALTYSVGVGSSPLAPFVLGGLFRGTTMFGLGTDVGAALRASTGGFARGDWGLALDAGVLWRSWSGGTYGDWPLQVILTGGAPWGFQLGVGAQFWNITGGTSAQGFLAVLELDLLRLTVNRQGATERWWPNPNPAGGHRETALLAW
jgi:hypothetical protein